MRLSSCKNSIVKEDSPERCYICGIYPTQVHHMLHGSMRAKADKYGLTCHLCLGCHMDLHDKGIMDRELQKDAQEAFEAAYGHDEFMKVFGKNFI